MEEHSGLTKLSWGAQCIHIFSVNFYQPLSTRASSGKTSLIYFLSLQSMLCLSPRHNSGLILLWALRVIGIFMVQHISLLLVYLCVIQEYIDIGIGIFQSRIPLVKTWNKINGPGPTYTKVFSLSVFFLTVYANLFSQDGGRFHNNIVVYSCSKTNDGMNYNGKEKY